MKDLHIEIVDKNAKKLFGKTAFITGGTRGVGREIALRLARDGANVVIAAKTDKPNPSKPGTVHTTVNDVETAGGRGFAVIMNIRNEDEVIRAVDMAVRKFGGIDILVNGASAISLTDTQDANMKDYDLINDVSARGTFLVTKTCLPYLKKSTSPHVLCIAPPINLKTGWFVGRVAYAIAMYGMSMCVIGMAEEFRNYHISVNALWPRFAIDSDQGAGTIAKQVCRKPTIMGDAAYAIFTREPRPIGEFFLDDQALAQTGVTDLTSYCVDPNYLNMLVLNSFVDDSGTIVQKIVQKATIDVDISQTTDKMDQIIAKFESLFDEALVKKTKRIFQIEVTGANPQKAYIDLKNGAGAFKKGESPEEPDIYLAMEPEIFHNSFVLGIKPSYAYINGLLVVKGDKTALRLLDNLVVKSVAKL